ncbi:branched-chain amino acid ABC transporter permease [Streptomyces sp. NPDC002577]
MLSVLNALTLSALFALLASGLALIFGLRKIMNFGHGALYMLGAYLAYSVAQASNFWVALVVVPIALAVAGALLEFLVFRPLKKRSELDIALITYGMSLVIGQLIIKGYGGETRPVQAPSALRGAVHLLGVQYPAYRLLIIGLGLGTVPAIFAWLKWTRTGLFVRAVSHDPGTAHMVGVDSKRIGLFVVCLGTAFAGVAGALAGPYLAVQPGMGDSIMISSLLIIAIGGLGSIGGAIGAAVLFGVVSAVGQEYVPDVASLLPYILLIVVLALRPQGFGGARSS